MYESFIKEFPVDIKCAESYPSGDREFFKLISKKGTYKDEWGSIWYVGEPGFTGEVKEPALDDWSKLKNFKPPYHLIKKRNKDFIDDLCSRSNEFILSSITARPFERIQFLRGTENLYMDIGYDRPEFYRLLKLVHEYYLKDIESWCKTAIDGVFFMDDWGSARDLLINPKIWREVFKPLYKDYCKLIHSYGKYTFFHSDGNIEKIFSDLIEVGVDAINSQIFAMDIETLAQEYKGKITFWGEIDRQHILPFGSTDDVFNAVIRIRNALDHNNGGVNNGGVIAQFSWGKDVSLENAKTVLKAWDKII